MKFDKIDLSTDEGRLLRAAIAVLTTTPMFVANKNEYRGTHMTPQQVIEVLIDVEFKCFQNGEQKTGQNMKSCSTVLEPFKKAIGEYFEKQSSEQRDTSTKIILAGEEILSRAIRSLNPDEYTDLEGLLVKVYSIHAKKQ